MSEKKSVSPRNQGRRDFLKIGGAATAALLTPSAFAVTPNTTLPNLPSNPRTPAAMPTRNLGKTGYKVGIFSLGGQAALEKRQQLRCRRAHHRPRARPWRQLHRHIIDLRRPRPLERAVRRQGHGATPQRGLPRHQDQGTHPRRLHAHDREVAPVAPDRSRRSLATARHRHHVRRRRRSSPRAAPWKRCSTCSSRRWCAISASPATTVPRRSSSASTATTSTPS